MTSAQTVEVFISYAQEDERLCEELEKHLKTLQREKAISTWHERKILAGMELKDEIDRYLNQAGIILLLVSPDFIASDYHWTVEVTRALERNSSGKSCVIPVLLRHADWETPPMDRLSPLPRNRKPVKSWVDLDEAFLQIIQGIREEVKKLTSKASYSPPDAGTAEQQVLYLKSAVNKVPTESSSASELMLELPLSAGEMLYGTKKKIDIEGSSILVTVPTGLTPSKKLRLQGKGRFNFISQKNEDLFLKIVNSQEFEGSLQEYQQRLRQYEMELRKAIQLEYPLSEYSRSGLQNYQAALRLHDEDIAFLEEKIISQELEKRQNQVTVLINEADLLLRQEQLDAAGVKYGAALRLDPTSIKARIGLGDVLSQQRRYHEASEQYRQAVLLNPDDVEAQHGLGDCLLCQEQFEEAIPIFSQAISLDPTYALARIELALSLLGAGRLQEAKLEFEQLSTLTFSDKTTRNIFRKVSGKNQAFYRCAWAIALASREDKTQQAIEELHYATEFLKKQDLSSSENTSLAFYHMMAGGFLAERGKLEEASTACHQAIQLDPNTSIFYIAFAQVIALQGRIEEAISAHNQAIRIDPNSADAHYWLGITLGEKGDFQGAVKAFKKAIQLDPENADTYKDLGIALKKQGKLEEAIAAHNQAIRIDPNHSVAYNNLGMALLGQGKVEEAISSFRRAIQIDPDYCIAYNNLGISLQEQGGFEEAIATFNQAIRANPEYAITYSNLGITLYEQGKLEEAITAYNKALEIDPSCKEARINLEYALSEH